MKKPLPAFQREEALSLTETRLLFGNQKRFTVLAK